MCLFSLLQVTNSSSASARFLPMITSAAKPTSMFESVGAVDLWASLPASMDAASASAMFDGASDASVFDLPIDERCKIWIDAGWQLRYGAVSRTLAQCVVQPGLGKGFSRFANVEIAVEPLLRTMIHTGVTLQDVRHCIMVRSVLSFTCRVCRWFPFRTYTGTFSTSQ